MAQDAFTMLTTFPFEAACRDFRDEHNAGDTDFDPLDAGYPDDDHRIIQGRVQHGAMCAQVNSGKLTIANPDVFRRGADRNWQPPRTPKAHRVPQGTVRH